MKRKKTAVLEHEAVAYAVDGKAYIINDDTKTARALDRDIIDFVINNEQEGLDESLEKQNTHILYNFIKPHFTEAVLKYGKIRVADYSIKYASHGFEIRDDRNFGEIVNINEWHNDYPTPEKVLEFIQTTIKRPKLAAKQVQKEEVERGTLLKLASLGKVTLQKQPDNTVMVVNKPVEQKKDRLHNDTELLMLRYKEKRQNYKTTVAQLKKRLPKLLTKEVVGIFTEFHRKNYSWRKLVILLKKAMDKYKVQVAQLKEERQAKVKQPAFTAPALYEPINPVIRSTDLYMANNGTTELFCIDRQHHTIDCKLVDVDVVWMKFQTRGPSGVKYWVTCTLEEYFANVVLHHYPKAMPLLMKVASGEIPAPQIRDLKFLKDPYQKYDPEVLRHPIDRDAFCKLCIDIFKVEGIEHCFMWYYTNDFKAGDQIRTTSAINPIWDYGEVISIDTGLTVRYEGGTVWKVKREETIQLFNWKKSKR